MLIKIKDHSIDIPNWLVFVGLIVADNVYVNHCKKKSYEKFIYVVKNQENNEEES